MNKIVAGLALLMISLSALADEEAVTAVAPQVAADPTGLIIFTLVFVGLIGGYGYVIWKNERNNKNTTV
jgi:hypothetical protein